MKYAWKILGSLMLFGLLGVFLLPPDEAAMMATGGRSPAGILPPAASPNNATEDAGPFVSQPVTPAISPAVRDLPNVPLEPVLDREINPRLSLDYLPGSLSVDPNWRDPAVPAADGNLLNTPAPILSFAGMSLANGGLGTPPDTNGDVGPNHYVQMVNVSFAIYDKSGNLLSGPHAIKQLWAGQGGICSINSAGDPVVVYDSLANRWLLSQFANNNSICLAISQTSDPTGAYYLYEFTNNAFPDYFKLGVWSNAYFMGANQSGQNVHAYDKQAMLNGQPATAIHFSKSGVGRHTFLLPADVDGGTPPPTGSPGYFYRFIDGDLFGGVDRLELFAFQPDFANPGNSTFTGPVSLPSQAFASLCNFSFSCIRQPNTNQRLDSITEWPMWRFAYRNFGTHEVLLGNHAVNVGNDQAGVRWFELRRANGGSWSIYQESTHAPDAHSRWMASMAMDGDGNIAIGYNASSTSLFPSLRYATRLATDPLNTLQTEATLQAGGGSQTGLNRWGDYSAVSVDPSDDCTFWFTGEYYTGTFSNNWSTRIGTFRIPSCGSGGPGVLLTMDYTYQMNNGTSGSGTFTYYDNGAFADSSGGGGVWGYQPNPPRLLMYYNDGSNCSAYMIGNFQAGGQVQGYRACTDGSGALGTWSGTIVLQNGELTPRALPR